MIHKKSDNLYLIDLDQKETGFRNFIASWLYKKGNVNILIDPGPSSTIPVLVSALKQLEVHHLNQILLTHIHIDHAGGTGDLLRHYPGTPVLCHPKGIPHLSYPEKLWEGTQKVLGDMAGIYGEIVPVPKQNLYYASQVTEQSVSIDVLETPGHAAHHVSFQINDLLFAGEALGVSVPEESGTYLRIASPPVFIYDVYRSSIEKLKRRDARTICFGHYDWKPASDTIFDSALVQLDLWMEIIETQMDQYDDVENGQIIDLIFRRDSLLKAFTALPLDIQQRELRFAANSLDGIKAYLRNKKKALQPA
jgi:glyoxylase-like metal-dependent hydrolase (beta-lactamase superfamily II)